MTDSDTKNKASYGPGTESGLSRGRYADRQQKKKGKERGCERVSDRGKIQTRTNAIGPKR